MVIIELIVVLISLAASWMIFKKMGRQGWEGIVPLYNNYILCEELYGNGWKFLCMFIPLYNVYFIIKLFIDWVFAFHKDTGFAIGMLFLPFVFQIILAFDNTAKYKDGSMANTTPDILTKVVDKANNLTAPTANQKDQRDDNALEKIEKLSELKDKGIISEEEYNEKKAKLLEQI